MLELVLALQLLGTPASAPELHLVPPLSLAGEAPLGQVRPELAGLPPALEPPAPGRRPVRAGTVLGASAGVAIADVASLIPVLYGLVLCIGDAISFGQTSGCDRATPFLAVGFVSFVLLPPAAGVLGARAAGELGDGGGRAYLYAFLLRLGMFGLASRAPGDLAVAVVLGSELVLVPWLISHTLAGAPLPEAGPWPTPVGAATPVRDPALALAGR